MAETPSKMLALNTVAPDFSLLDTITNKTLSLHEIRGKKATVWDSEGAQATILEQEGAEYTGEPVTIDGKIVTANGPAAAEEFGQALSVL